MTSQVEISRFGGVGRSCWNCRYRREIVGGVSSENENSATGLGGHQINYKYL